MPSGERRAPLTVVFAVAVTMLVGATFDDAPTHARSRLRSRVQVLTAAAATAATAAAVTEAVAAAAVARAKIQTIAAYSRGSRRSRGAFRATAHALEILESPTRKRNVKTKDENALCCVFRQF